MRIDSVYGGAKPVTDETAAKWKLEAVVSRKLATSRAKRSVEQVALMSECPTWEHLDSCPQHGPRPKNLPPLP